MEKGKVRWFNPTFRYGFLAGPENEDVFFHGSLVPPKQGKPHTLRKGDWVHFNCVQTELGLKATEIKLEEGFKKRPPQTKEQQAAAKARAKRKRRWRQTYGEADSG